MEAVVRRTVLASTRSLQIRSTCEVFLETVGQDLSHRVCQASAVASTVHRSSACGVKKNRARDFNNSDRCCAPRLPLTFSDPFYL